MTKLGRDPARPQGLDVSDNMLQGIVSSSFFGGCRAHALGWVATAARSWPVGAEDFLSSSC